MKSLSKNFGKALLAGSIVFLASCSKDDADDNSNNPNVTPKSTTVKGVLESESQFSMMNEAVEESGQSSLFANSSSNITLFAANNDAFEDLFAELNVQSITELKSQMGDEAFADLILYHAINGKFNVEDFGDGFEETNSESDNGSKLDLLIKNENNARLVFNGNDENGATTVSNTTLSAENGSVIEINGILSAQSTIENMEEGEEEESAFMLNILANADASVRAMLEDENDENTVLLASEEEIKSMLSINIGAILEVEDLEELLDANNQSTLLGNFGVTILADLMADLRLDDLLNLNVTVSEIFSVMEKEDNTELMNTLIFDGNLDSDSMINQGSVTSRGGITFDVSSNTQGNLILTDDNGNNVILDSESTQSVNGSVYTIIDIQES